MDHQKKALLEEKARVLRVESLKMIYKAKSGHPGGSFSAAEIMSVLYYHEMRIDPANPGWEDRDRFILSKGHVCPVVYSVLAEKGYFGKEELATLRKIGSNLQGHPDMRKVKGFDMTSGSLGNGIGIGVGMALGAKISGKSFRIYVLAGDGEMQEGTVWEAAMSAAHFKTDNFVVIVDKNNLQVDGFVPDIMGIEPLKDKWLSFGFHVIEIDGHDVAAVAGAFAEAKTIKNKPVCIIANTVKGKGVSYMENVCEWHGNSPNDEQYKIALRELGAHE